MKAGVHGATSEAAWRVDEKGVHHRGDDTAGACVWAWGGDLYRAQVWHPSAPRLVTLRASRELSEAKYAAGLWLARRNGKAAVAPTPEPIPMVLHCPECLTRHVDVGEFATKVHHTHSCQECGLTWRPAVVPMVGVQFLPGFKNVPEGSASPREGVEPCRCETISLCPGTSALVGAPFHDCKPGRHCCVCGGAPTEVATSTVPPTCERCHKVVPDGKAHATVDGTERLGLCITIDWPPREKAVAPGTGLPACVCPFPRDKCPKCEVWCDACSTARRAPSTGAEGGAPVCGEKCAWAGMTCGLKPKHRGPCEPGFKRLPRPPASTPTRVPGAAEVKGPWPPRAGDVAPPRRRARSEGAGMSADLRPRARAPLWRHVNALHHWIKRGGAAVPSRYWDCAKCGQFVLDMAPAAGFMWPWRFNTVGPCSSRPEPEPTP